MTDHLQPPDRDEVLLAFQEECPRPTARELIDWTRRYPQFADDIRAHAAVARDWDARRDPSAEEPDEILLARAYSRALNVLYQADAARADRGNRFQDILASRNMNVPALAREVGRDVRISRSVIADLVGGRMRAPVGRRFLDAVCRTLLITHERFYGALDLARTAPRVGLARSDGAPTANVRSYEDAVRASDMSDSEIRYWLDED
jgi:hypothetical protein